MEPKERMLLEIVAGAVLVIFLVLASVMVVSAYKSPETTITNSYNTYTYNTYPARTELVSAKPYIVDRRDYRDYARVIDRKDYRDYSGVYYSRDDIRYKKSDYTKSDRKYDKRYLRYDDFGNFRTYEGIVGNRVNNYEVYVRNRDYAGGYFKTTFYFEDYYGNVDSDVVTHYIGPREENRFVFKDISPGKYDYKRWWYMVDSMTKVQTKTHYTYPDTHSFYRDY